MVWGSDADIAGPMTVEGTGMIPATGLYDTVYNWDMKIQLGDGVKMTFKPGGDSTKFIGSDGWVRITRGGIDAEAEVAADLEDRPERRASDRQPTPLPELPRCGEVAQTGGCPLGSGRAERHHQPALRHRRPHEAEDHLGSQGDDHRRRRRGGQDDAPRHAGAVDL